MSYFRSFLFASFALFFLAACGDDDGPRAVRPDAGGITYNDGGGIVCQAEGATGCEGDNFVVCERDGEFLSPDRTDCAAMKQICVEQLGCAVCRPEAVGCLDGNAVRCNADGTEYDLVEECNIEEGFTCRDGQCKNLCEQAVEDRSYVGCEFYAADLDNASLGAGRDASAQQYAVVVSNPGPVPTEVVVEVNDAAPGEELALREVERVTVLPGDLEVLELPRREVDGSSSNATCFPDDRTCPGDEVCLCSSGDTESPCFCRVSADSDGMNDGTHTALSSNAYRLKSQLPIIAYQFNPLDNVGVFSNDASLLLPTSAIDRKYTVVGWPQTIADADGDPDRDFDPNREDEDLRASLTIVGTLPNTRVTVDLGDRATRVMGAGPIPESTSGDVLDLEVGPFDVINLETQGLNADFTGSIVDASAPVVVFTGSEASDAPRFETYATRQCCADHLEEQLFPDRTLGRRFIIARMPKRSASLNEAFVTADSVGEPNEPEWVRVVAVQEGVTNLTTTLPAPDDMVALEQRQSIIFRADQDFVLQADKAVAVLQVLSSQEAVGVPSEYPGGDPAIIAVPPVEQYRQDYVFLTPDLYAFDYLVITAPRTAQVLLDGTPVREAGCTVSPADGMERMMGARPPDEVIYRCQFSFPDVIGLPNVRVEDGVQNDGVHTVVADKPVGIVVYGFDAFVSYAYAGGLNLDVLN